MLTPEQMEQRYQATRKRRLTPEEMEAQYQASLGGQQAEPAQTVDIQPVTEPVLPTQGLTKKPIPQLSQGPLDPMTQYAHRQNYLIQQTEEENPLVQPWVDPVDAATAGFGAGAKIATSAGKPVLSALARGAAAAIPAAATDIPIGMLAEQAEQSEGGALALLTALGAGVLSGTTIEPAVERAIYNTASRAAMRFRRSPKIVAMAKRIGIDPEAQIAGRMREHNAAQVAQAQAAAQPTYQRPGVPDTPPPPRMDDGIADAMAAAEGIPRGARRAPTRTIQQTVEPPPPTHSPVTGQPYRVAAKVDEGQIAAEIVARAQEGAPAERAAEVANKRFTKQIEPNLWYRTRGAEKKDARLSAEAMEEAYQRSLKEQAQARQVNQTPQAGEALRRRLAEEEAAGKQRIIENARRFTEERPEAVRMAQGLINAPQISKEAQEQAVGRGKIDEIEQRTRRPIVELEDSQLLAEASAFKHAGRDDLAQLLTEELRYRQSKQAAERRAKAAAAPKGETLRWRLQQMKKGGVDVLNFEGEARDIPPMVRRNVLRRGGEPVDTAEETLRNEGWLHADEELLDVLRDPEALKRRNLHKTDIGGRTRNLTDQEARLKSEMDYEEEMPPGFEDVPEHLQAKVASGEMTVDEARKTGKAVGGEMPFSMAGGAAGIERDEEGNYTFDPKKALAGVAVGAAGVKGARLYAGLRAKGKSVQAIQKAAMMEIEGESQDAIRKATGWFRGLDNKYRFEIDDSGAKFVQPLFTKDRFSGDLKNLLYHPALYENYPEAKNIFVRLGVDPDFKGTSGNFTPGVEETDRFFGRDPEIKLRARTPEDAKEAIIHEIQHYIQEMEDFAKGGSPSAMDVKLSQVRQEFSFLDDLRTLVRVAVEDFKGDLRKAKKYLNEIDIDITEEHLQVAKSYGPEEVFRSAKESEDELRRLVGKSYDAKDKSGWTVADGRGQDGVTGYDAYRRLGGEIEARDAAARRDMTPEQRSKTRPYETTGEIKRSSESPILYVHPSTITGPVGGIAAGVDWEAYEKDGTIKIDPKRALVGALAGASGPVAWRKAKGLGDAIAEQWEKRLADPLINWAKKRAHGMIVNEEIRHALGMNRSEKLRDYLRDYYRETERVSNKAVELGKKLHKLAPTKAEQRRLYQIVRGGVTLDPKKREAAAEFRKLFDELRDQLKKADLLQYSRFDGLTRKERAKLRKIIARGPGGKPVTEEEFFSQADIDPEVLEAGRGWRDEYDVTGKRANTGRTADVNARQSKWSNQELADLYRMTGQEQKVALNEMGLTYPEFQRIYMAQVRRKGEVPEKWRDSAPDWATEQIPIEAYEREKSPVEWAREKLHDYYHYGSAQEYAPIYYKEHEGLSPAERKVTEDEIKGLKKQSRYMNPEGDPVLENQIAGLEKLLAKGKKGRAELRKARTKLNKGYAHRRLDIPEDVQKMLGQIDEAAFAGAKGAFVQRTDLLKDKLFKQVLDNPEWAIPTRIKDPRTGQVTVKKVEPPENFVMVQSEDGEKYGALEGAYVRRDVWDDLREVEEWRGSFIRNWDKLLGAWKYGKVVLNPATHARNTMSNMILAYMGGVNPADAKTYGKAALAVAAGENDAGEVGRLRKLFKKVSPEQAKKYYQEAADWGLFNDTFVNTEITKLRDELEGLRDSAPKKFLRRAFQIPAEMYQGNEKLFKTALFIKQREAGKSIDEAARHAEKFLFNYADIPPWVKHMKRWVAPFFTFTYKAVPLFGEMAIRKPWKLAALGGAIYGLEEFSKSKLGLSEDEAATERRRLPEWQKKRTLGLGPYHHVLMPFKDKWGNNLYWDLSYILPYGNLGEDWGQSKIPLSDLLPSSPAFTMTAALLTNTDPFTGRDIYNKVLDSNLKIAAKYVDLALKQAAPSLAPGGYGFNKLKTGIENTFFDKDVKDWADRPIELQTAIASTLFGIKLSPANTRKLREFEMREVKQIKKEVSIEKGRVRGRLRKGKITKDEAEKEFKRLNELNKKLILEKLGRE